MHQFFAPGGCWMRCTSVFTFHATDHPALQPCPDPACSRFENAIPGRRSVPLVNSLLSTSSPVAQRWCGATPASSALKCSTTLGPVTPACVTTGHTRLPLHGRSVQQDLRPRDREVGRRRRAGERQGMAHVHVLERHPAGGVADRDRVLRILDHDVADPRVADRGHSQQRVLSSGRSARRGPEPRTRMDSNPTCSMRPGKRVFDDRRARRFQMGRVVRIGERHVERDPPAGHLLDRAIRV